VTVAVRVRLFAALREAAGAEYVDVDAATAAALVEELAERYGEPMRSRLRVATLLVDGDSVPKTDVVVDLAGAQEVVLLPPFAGG
jgi:molybdopterin converting factor small subunit